MQQESEFAAETTNPIFSLSDAGSTPVLVPCELYSFNPFEIEVNLGATLAENAHVIALQCL